MDVRRRDEAAARQTDAATVDSAGQRAADQPPSVIAAVALADSAAHDRPLLPPGVDQRYLVAQHPPGEGCRAIYRPALLGQSRLHFARASFEIDQWEAFQRLAILDAQSVNSPWEKSIPVGEEWEFDNEAEADFRFAESPAELSNAKSYAQWSKSLATYFYRTQTLTLWKCQSLKLRSTPEETEGEFRVRLAHFAKEQRDKEVQNLHKRYAKKLATLQARIQTAEAAYGRETEQYERAKYDSVIKIGSSLLGAMFGRKLASSTNLTRASTSMRSVSGAAQQRGDIERAKEKVETLQRQLKELEDEFERDVQTLSAASDVSSLELESLEVRPRKSDIQLDPLQLVWTPWRINSDGMVEPLFEIAAP